MSRGYIYILKNPAYPHLLKIGMTTRSPEERASELSVPTGVPMNYEVVFVEVVPDCAMAERILHQKLEKCHANKEFYELPLGRAIELARRIADEMRSKDSGLSNNYDTNALQQVEKIDEHQDFNIIEKIETGVVLFVCTGNTCRSPMASAHFSKLLKVHNLYGIETTSAGVMTIVGLTASNEAVQIMSTEGIDIQSHRSKPLTPELVCKADLIMCMSSFHRQSVLRMVSDAKDKTHLLKVYTKSDMENIEISDPMGCTLEVHQKCFYKHIKPACEILAEMVMPHRSFSEGISLRVNDKRRE